MATAGIGIKHTLRGGRDAVDDKCACIMVMALSSLWGCCYDTLRKNV